MRRRYLGPGEVVHEFGVPRKHKLETVDYPFDRIFRVIDPSKPPMLKTVLHGTRSDEGNHWLVVARPIEQRWDGEYFGELELSSDIPPEAVLTLAHEWIRFSPKTRLVSENIVDLRKIIPTINSLLPEINTVCYKRR